VNITFFELEGWEKPTLIEHLPEHRLALHEEPLSPAHYADLADCEVISPFIYSRIADEVLDAMPALRLVVTRSTGYDHIDIEACNRRGVVVCNVQEYGSQTVAEHCFALILALSRQLIKAYTAMRVTGAPARDARELRGFDLRGKTLGVVGAGGIGLHVIRIAGSFGMRVLVFDMTRRQTLADVLGFEYTDLDTLLAASDIVTLHCPATPATTHMINRESISRMKHGALLINTARGELVDTTALLEALQSGQIAGAGLDVFEGEAIVREEAQLLSTEYDRQQLLAAINANNLLKRDDVIVTPHNAFNSQEAVERILSSTVASISAFIAGKPTSTVEISGCTGDRR
jgi:D-lactate dehydrogenase